MAATPSPTTSTLHSCTKGRAQRWSQWAINCDHDNLYFKSISGYTQQQKHDLMMRVLTKRLGMRGPEFKTARLHLTSAFLTEAESENTAA